MREIDNNTEIVTKVNNKTIDDPVIVLDYILLHVPRRKLEINIFVSN